MITRNRIMTRARYGWPQESVEFSKTAMHSSGYLCNASGYVSMCWDIPAGVPGFYGGLSTLAMDAYGWAIEIPPLELKPGDALGLLGPGSVGTDGGHVVIFESWLNNDHTLNYFVYWGMLPNPDPGSKDRSLGPVRRVRPYDHNRWHSYRFRDVVDK